MSIDGENKSDKTLSELKNERKMLRDSGFFTNSIEDNQKIISSVRHHKSLSSPDNVSIIYVHPPEPVLDHQDFHSTPSLIVKSNSDVGSNKSNNHRDCLDSGTSDATGSSQETLNTAESDQEALSDDKESQEKSFSENNSFVKFPRQDFVISLNALTIPGDIKPKGFAPQFEPPAENGDKKDIDKKKPSRLKTVRGLLLAFCSAIFFSLTTVIVKYVSDVHPGEMACFRFLGILFLTLPLLIESGQQPFGPKNLRFWLILRGIAGASSLYFRYSALHYLPIGDATVIVLSMPVFVCIFAKVFLKESCGIFHVISLAVTLIGIAFTTKLNVIFGSTAAEVKAAGVDRDSEIIGLLYGMAATLVGSSAYVIVRKVRGVHHSVILFNFSWVAIAEMSVITYSLDGFKLPDCGINPWLLIILAILSFYGQLMLTKALQAEEAGLVSVTRASAEVIFAFLFQITIFRHMPDLWSIVGALLVTVSVLLTSSRKWVVTLPAESRWRKALNFVTK